MVYGSLAIGQGLIVGTASGNGDKEERHYPGSEEEIYEQPPVGDSTVGGHYCIFMVRWTFDSEDRPALNSHDSR